MKAAWARAERDGEVRQAARSWHEANVIDEGTLSATEALYPAAWPNPTVLWSVLLFFFVTVFVAALLFSVGIAHQVEATAFLLAVGLAFAADRLRPSASTVKTAAGGAAAFWSVVCLLIGTALAIDQGERTFTVMLLVGAAAWAVGAWRWGYPAFALLAAVFFFLLLARSPSGRALWLVLGAALAAACAPLLDRPALAPSHRRGAAAVLLVSLAAVYGAANLYALDQRIVESMSATGWSTPHSPAAAVRVLAAIATAVFPVFVLVWAIRARRTLLLDAGIVSAALSLATLRFYVHIAPLWAILSAAGCGLVLLALGAHRWLGRSASRERGGFTAEPLFEDKERQQTLGALGALSLSPQARSVSPEPGRFTGGGGSFGGGGTSGTF
jgi:MFS family permease